MVYALSSDSIRDSFDEYFLESNFFTLATSLGLVLLVRTIIGGLELFMYSKFKIGDVIMVDGVKGKVEHIGLANVIITRKDSSIATIPAFKFTTRSVTNLSRERNMAPIELHVAVKMPPDCDARELSERLCRDIDEIFLPDAELDNESEDGALPPIVARRVEYSGMRDSVHRFIVRCMLGEYG